MSDISLLIGTIHKVISLLWAWIGLGILWSSLIIVGIVIDMPAMTNSTLSMKLISLVSVLCSVFVVDGAIREIKQSQKPQHQQYAVDLPLSYEETLKLDDVSVINCHI